jgi:hypothetical protein
MSMASTKLTKVISSGTTRLSVGAATKPLLFACLLMCSGCWFQKAKPVAFTPPPPHPPAKLGPPPVLPDPPELEVNVGTYWTPEIIAVVPDVIEPPKPVPRPKPPVVVAGPKAPQTLPDQPAAPKLGQIFTAEQIREYNKDLDDSLERVRRQLVDLGKKRLSGDDLITMERIRTFQKQAEQARLGDLFEAVSLAHRADALAQDLLRR